MHRPKEIDQRLTEINRLLREWREELSIGDWDDFTMVLYSDLEKRLHATHCETCAKKKRESAVAELNLWRSQRASNPEQGWLGSWQVRGFGPAVEEVTNE